MYKVLKVQISSSCLKQKSSNILVSLQASGKNAESGTSYLENKVLFCPQVEFNGNATMLQNLNWSYPTGHCLKASICPESTVAVAAYSSNEIGYGLNLLAAKLDGLRLNGLNISKHEHFCGPTSSPC